MYIKKIVLENIRCFTKLELDFSESGGSVLIAGDNGDGKTTILQSIAMGLCDKDSAASLHRELHGEFVRKKKEVGSIKIYFEEEENVYYEIETVFKSLKTFESVKQIIWKHEGEERKQLIQEKFPWEKIFVCGYGAGRRVKGEGKAEEYLAVDAVYTLFKYYEILQGSELAMRRLIDKARENKRQGTKQKEKRVELTRRRLYSLLKKVLNLEGEGRILLTYKGIEVEGPWGRYEVGVLGDGYKATITWVLDFLAYRMVSGKSLNPKIMSGIIIIDEIEQHLHPRWQLKVMELLQDAFPKIQFIATTHSPLVVSGCKECTVYTIEQGKCTKSRVYGWLAEDVYREVMGLKSSVAPEVEKLIDKFEELYMKKLKKTHSTNDLNQLEEIEHILRGLGRQDTQIIAKKLRNMNKYLEEESKDSKK